VDFLASLKPEKMVYGQSGLHRYFGAMLADDLVVFENVEYGNAAYVMYDDWHTLSQKSRTELLSGKHGDNFERVIHAGEWKNRVRFLIEARLQKKAA